MAPRLLGQVLVPRLEREMAAPVAAHFAAQGYETFFEVHFNGRIADVVAVKGEEVVAVELKLRDHRTALRQATAYQVGCQRSFLALPLPVALDCLRKERTTLERGGVGLLAVNMPMGDVRELVPARINEGRFLPFLADALRAP